MTVFMNLGKDSYEIVVEKGVLARAKEQLDLNRRVLVVTDSGVPRAYAESLAAGCKSAVIHTVPQGEASKSLTELEGLLQTMLSHGFSRKDCVVAVGGGVVGDLAGFAASVYMRGVDFYNIPTTLLAQIDSSIGGKTAVHLGGIKNVVGAFYQPKKVLIDPELLKTLPRRQLSNGLAEAIKMALTSDEALFRLLENGEAEERMEELILGCLNVKKSVVEKDEKETGLRRILNFGHTVGHAIESSQNMSELYHGECVALGMLPLCGEALRPRVVAVLKKYGLYQSLPLDWEKIGQALRRDKKADGDTVEVTAVHTVGSFERKTLLCEDLIAQARACLKGENQ